jgi:rifampin ADP-ribosylating transferase
MNNTKYYHGGRGGLRGWILPPNQTGAKSLADYSNVVFCDKSKVYVSTCFNSALLYAFQPGSRIYEVEPIGELMPDPDHFDEGVSFMCDKAKIIRAHRIKNKTRNMVKKALMHP